MAGGAKTGTDAASGLNYLQGSGQPLSYASPFGGQMYSGGIMGALQDPKMQHLLGGIGQQLMQRQQPQMQAQHPMFRPMMGQTPQLGAPMQQGAPQYSPAPWLQARAF